MHTVISVELQKHGDNRGLMDTRRSCGTLEHRSVHHTAAVQQRYSSGILPTMQQPSERFRLGPETVRFEISEEELHLQDQKQHPHRIIGQPRAVEALHLALAIRAKGYNVFAAGPSGTGKRTAIMRILREQPYVREHMRDIAVVNNFSQQDRPRVLYFSAGDATRFRHRMQDLLDGLKEQLPALMQKGGFRAERDRIMLDVEGRETEALQSFETQLKAEGFAIVQVAEEEERRSDISPIIDGEPVPLEELPAMVSSGSLSRTHLDSIRGRYYQLMDQMNQMFFTFRGERIVAENQLRELQHETIQPLLERMVGAIARDFVGDEIRQFLQDMQRDLMENLDLFVPDDPGREAEAEQELLRYGVNIIADHSTTVRTPVLFESHPDYQKLFGFQEMSPELEGRHGFLSLRAGSLINASGGYLVLRAEDILTQEELWNGLKRALQDEQTEIRSLPMPFGAPVPMVKPEPVQLDLKVILMGSEHIYDLLFYQDEEFGKLFKILSEFDMVMENLPETRRAYREFMEMICQEESLLPLTSDGMAAVIEYGVRLGEFRNKISTRFSLIADLLRESSHWAAADNGTVINRTAVEKARQKRRFLHNLPEEKYDEQISSGEMILQVHGERVGAINGLSVLDRGYYAFGRPMLITARVAPGSDGIINIERESGLSGELHDKGMYILQGFLQATYATDFPLSINASIGFEQSYAEVDGDSASSTEIYVLLSAISELPLRQDIAVTGSVNQFGQIQPVGGISEKIEGFYETCRLMGLTGTQGVLIPRTNIQNLILSRDVQEAVEQRQFHIFAVDTVDEGIELLTGTPAGTRGSDSRFPRQTVNGMVERRLRQMATQVKDFS